MNKSIKKSVAFCLSVISIFSLAACGGSPSPDELMASATSFVKTDDTTVAEDTTTTTEETTEATTTEETTTTTQTYEMVEIETIFPDSEVHTTAEDTGDDSDTTAAMFDLSEEDDQPVLDLFMPDETDDAVGDSEQPVVQATVLSVDDVKATAESDGSNIIAKFATTKFGVEIKYIFNPDSKLVNTEVKLTPVADISLEDMLSYIKPVLKNCEADKFTQTDGSYHANLPIKDFGDAYKSYDTCLDTVLQSVAFYNMLLEVSRTEDVTADTASDGSTASTYVRDDAVLAKADALTFVLNDKDVYVTITGYKGTESSIRLPATIEGTKVQQISNFSGESVVYVELPNSLTTIAAGAFSGCDKLEVVNILSDMTVINERAFMGCENLKTVIIPATVTEIEKKAFASCSCLAEIILPDSVTHLGDNVFLDSDSVVVTYKGKKYTSEDKWVALYTDINGDLPEYLMMEIEAPALTTQDAPVTDITTE